MLTSYTVMMLNLINAMKTLWLACLAVLLSSPTCADGELLGDIRFQAATDEVSWVGQQLELQLELWTNGFSFANQLFVLPEVKGAYLLQPDATTVKLSDNRNGEQWQGLRYTFLLYPQKEGRLEVPSFDVSFAARAGFGSEPANFRFSTGSLQVETRLPPGADPGSLLVSTTSFTVESAWTPADGTDSPVNLKVGDAITLTVTRRAEDVPGMVFEPLPEIAIDGLGIYPKTPQLNDRVDRGSLVGERTDSVTFVCEREGNYPLPVFVFQWWDPVQESLSEQRIESLELNVAANPDWAAASDAAADILMPFGWRGSLTTVLALLVLVVLWFAGIPRLRNYLQQQRSVREAGEPWAFRQVRLACDSGNAAEADRAIMLWLSRVAGLQAGCILTELAESSGNMELKKEATTLQERVASGSTEGWQGDRLARLLVGLREGLNQPRESEHALHALNPPPIR